MRFLALIRKELRECLPWMLLAAIVFLTTGGFALRAQAYHHQLNWYYVSFFPGSSVEHYQLAHHSHLGGTGPWLFFTSIVLGLALGIRQFWVAHFIKTWGFVLHRSATRLTILLAKLAGAMIAFAASIGVIWLILYWHTCNPRLFTMPPASRIFVEGWILIALGLVVYLGTALSGLSTARWYTTKMFGLGFAAIIIFMTLFQWLLSWAFTAMILGTAILLSQTIHTFLNREF